MDKLEKEAKQSVLKGIMSFMGKLNAESFRPKPAEPEKKKEDSEEEITEEMLEKLKALQAENE